MIALDRIPVQVEDRENRAAYGVLRELYDGIAGRLTSACVRFPSTMNDAGRELMRLERILQSVGEDYYFLVRVDADRVIRQLAFVEKYF